MILTVAGHLSGSQTSNVSTSLVFIDL